MNNKKIPVGGLVSADITTKKADELKKFYEAVMGWTSEDMKMSDEQGEYADYVMKDKEGNPVGGVCHARGMNNDLPTQWIVYVNVENVGESAKKCKELGGKVLKEFNHEGTCVYALIQDPSGAVIALTKVE